MKLCSACGLTRPNGDFSPRQKLCRPCRNALRREQSNKVIARDRVCACGTPLNPYHRGSVCYACYEREQSARYPVRGGERSDTMQEAAEAAPQHPKA